MRVFIAISIVVASVSSASAQFAMDHGHAADAAQAARASRAAADAKAAAIASGAPLSPSQQTNFYVGNRGTVKPPGVPGPNAAGRPWSKTARACAASNMPNGIAISPASIRLATKLLRGSEFTGLA